MINRIPDLSGTDIKAIGHWFSEMADKGLIFHPEDPADSIVFIKSGEPFFTKEEALKAQSILDECFAKFGDEEVNSAAYPHFMRAAGFDELV